MNPSTSGWIEKFLREFDNDQYSTKWSINTLYSDLKKVGFIYGNSIETIIPNTSGMVYSEEEKTKINLFATLVLIYYDTIKNANREDCINAIVQFYNFMDTKKSFFLFSNVLPANKTEKLEKIIHTRIQTNESIFKKNFSHLLTNALLFIDVLAFDYFLVYTKNPFEYAAKFEETVTNTVFLALNSKEKQNEHDKLLIKLFASSVRYTDISIENTSFDYIELDPYTDILEKKYILDLTSMAVWNDQVLDQGEQSFMMALGEELQIPETDVQYSINSVKKFINTHKEQLSYFKYSHPALHFYKQTTKTVRILILRNKKRLIKEISESKDLMVLLGQSTLRDLSKEEKKQVKKQLLDICKTIPSLTIFILPGGSLLLPLLVKFIPQLLPSAFNENKS